jgi:voltage-gated sodium channel
MPRRRKRPFRLSEFLRAIAEAPMFQNLITLVIIVAAVLVGIETYPKLHHEYATVLHIGDKIILGIFIGEAVVKIGAEGSKPWRYFMDPWNVFDFAIVVACLLPFSGSAVTVLRLLRLLRVLKLVRALPKLQILVSALLKSIPSMAYVGILLGLLFYVYSVAGVFFFSHNDPMHFGDLPLSALTLFRVVTLEGWTEILYINMYGCAKFGYESMPELCTQSDAMPGLSTAYFVSFVLIGTMVVLNLFIGVIMNGMEEAQEEAASLDDDEKKAAGKMPTVGDSLGDVEKRLLDVQTQLAELHRRVAKESQRRRDLVAKSKTATTPSA